MSMSSSPGTHEYTTLHSKRDFANVIVKDLEMEIMMDCLDGSNVIIRVLTRGKWMDQRQRESNVMIESTKGYSIQVHRGLFEEGV